MATSTDVEDHFRNGQVTVLLSSETADLERCVRALGASGIRGSIEEVDLSGEGPLVKAAVPCDRKPSMSDIEASKRVVVQALSDSNISHEIRGVGSRPPAKGDATGPSLVDSAGRRLTRAFRQPRSQAA